MDINFILKHKKIAKSEKFSRNFARKKFTLSFSSKIFNKINTEYNNTYSQILPILYINPTGATHSYLDSKFISYRSKFNRDYYINLNFLKNNLLQHNSYSISMVQTPLLDIPTPNFSKYGYFKIPFEYFIHQQNSYFFIYNDRYARNSLSESFFNKNITSIKPHLTKSNIFYQSFSRSQNMMSVFTKYYNITSLKSKLLFL